MATSKECPFYLGRTSKECHTELYAEIEAKFPKVNQKDPRTGITRKTGGRKKVGFSNPDSEGFVQVGVSPGIARIDAVPDEPLPPASVKPGNSTSVSAPHRVTAYPPYFLRSTLASLSRGYSRKQCPLHLPGVSSTLMMAPKSPLLPLYRPMSTYSDSISSFYYKHSPI